MSRAVEIRWLLAAVAKGDAVAFERLYGATCAKLYGVVLRILRRPDLAGDVMRQPYLHICRDAGDYAPPRSSSLPCMTAITLRSPTVSRPTPHPPPTAAAPPHAT